MTVKQFRFFRGYIREISESFFLNDAINSRQCDKLQSFPDTKLGKSCAEQLFSRKKAEFPTYRLQFHLKKLREMDGSPFDYIEIIFERKTRRKKRVCFVGHRFVPSVTKALRWNLRQVLEPYNVQLDWSGKDIRSVQIFDDIVRRIKKVNFCIFDNRATMGRPNVYIEVGIAYAVGTPFVLFDYARQSTESFPSDLSHSFAIRYFTYQRLFREFYATLPVFFKRNFGNR